MRFNPRAMLFLKQDSGINRGATRVGPTSELARMSKTGDMPKSMTSTGTPEDYERLFEAVDRYYDMPSKEYLKAYGVRFDDALHMKEQKRYNERTYRYEKTGEYYLTRRLAVLKGKDGRSISTSVDAPLGTSVSSHQGALKWALWHSLSILGVLDRTQFIKKR